MPNNLDFTTLKDVKTIEVNPESWISPLHVEYGITEENLLYDQRPCFCWRVKGTLHTFVIPIARIDFISSGDYKKHFEHALEVFREDFLEWKDEGFIHEWAREYRDQFANFIVI